MMKWLRRSRLQMALKSMIYYKAACRRQTQNGMREQMADSIIASLYHLIAAEGMIQKMESAIPDASHHIKKEKL